MPPTEPAVDADSWEGLDIDDIAAVGRCPECWTLAGFWHKPGCSLEQAGPAETQAAIKAAMKGDGDGAS